MLLFNLDEFMDNPIALVAYVGAIAVALGGGIAFHEFCHAWAAHELGDDTAARQGRLTLNPLRHLDPAGTILMLLVGFGWGRPTPINPYKLRNGAKRGSAMVAAIGPLSNFAIAAAAALPLRLGAVDTITTFDAIADASGGEIVGLFLVFIVAMNVFLGVFNLIPIHPLDGFKVAVGVLPDGPSRQLAALAPWGPGILMSLLVVGFLTPFNPLGEVIGALGDFVFKIIL